MARRENFNISGGGHRAPIPLGSKVGNMLYSSAIGGGRPAEGAPPLTIAEQAHTMFQNVKTLVEMAGGTIEDIVHVQLLLKDRGDRAEIDKEWIKMWPDENNRPARHATQVELGVGGDMQCEIVAVIN